MFNFGGITHIIDNPNGTYSYVGSVPLNLMQSRKVRPDIDTAVHDAINAGATLCAAEGCACRKLFPARPMEQWHKVAEGRKALQSA